MLDKEAAEAEVMRGKGESVSRSGAARRPDPVLTGGKARSVKPNRRSEETISSMFLATEEVVSLSMSAFISIIAVSAQVVGSYGTFVRFLASLKNLNIASPRHKHDDFHRVLLKLAISLEGQEGSPKVFSRIT